MTTRLAAPSVVGRAGKAWLFGGATTVMGIVNATPDSFADEVDDRGGSPSSREISRAIERGIDLAEQGAQILDVGGESTRPGSVRVEESVEMARVLPVVEALVGAGFFVSVDTVRSSVASQAIRYGAAMVNDVSGGLADPGILQVVADAQVPYVLGHWRTPFDHYSTHVEVVSEVVAELSERAACAIAAGINPAQLILDPGIGFAKTSAQNWALVSAAGRELARVGYPMVWGISRKRFLAEAYDHTTEPWERDSAGIAVAALLARARVWGLRVHTVAEYRAAIAVVEKTRQESP